MIVSLIAAASENNVIGAENRLVWKLADDMAFFMHTTLHHTVIMGRKTYDSMGKALKNRKNVVISRNPALLLDDAQTYTSIPDSLRGLHAKVAEEVFIIGGAQIYELAMPLANRIYLTRVHATVQGDAYFPKITEKNWELIFQKDKPANARNQYAASYLIYDRRKI